MKRLTIFIFLLIGVSRLCAQDAGIGEEIIEPLRFPKFSLTGVYELNRKFHGFADSTLRMDVERRFNTTMSFEAGLVKYFNAGGLFSLGISSFKKPIGLKVGLFAKPYIPLGERFSLFTRIAGGFAIDLAFYPSAAEYYSSFDSDGSFGRVFKGQKYSGIPYGGFGAATLGIEAFPFSRIGIALEWGIQATFLHGSKKMPLVDDPKRVAGAPESLNYMLYEFPVMVSLHIII